MQNEFETKCEGYLRFSNVEKYKKILDHAVKDPFYTRITFDLLDTTFIDSIGMTLLISLQKSSSHEGKIFVIKVNKKISEMLKLLYLHKVLTIVEN